MNRARKGDVETLCALATSEHDRLAPQSAQAGH